MYWITVMATDFKVPYLEQIHKNCNLWVRSSKQVNKYKHFSHGVTYGKKLSNRKVLNLELQAESNSMSTKTHNSNFYSHSINVRKLKQHKVSHIHLTNSYFIINLQIYFSFCLFLALSLAYSLFYSFSFSERFP